MGRIINKYAILIFGVFVVINACQQKSDKNYYETGELKTEISNIKGSDSMSYYVEYFKNGQKKLEGLVKFDSIADGEYKYYYADGKLCWAGKIKENVIQDKYKWHWKDCKNCFNGIEIKGNPDSLIIGTSYKFRVIMPNVNPSFYSATDIAYKDLTMPEPNDLFTYPFSFTYLPNEKGVYFIRIVFMNKNGQFIIGDPNIILTIKSNVSDWDILNYNQESSL